ncbi:MAG TPA: acyl-CoA dehydrogenase family protein [Vicinamibacterales bacterium]|nr:acyl-CoA dehydrogenase family protein [Vicinamibacterales bacterium]
MVVADTPTRLVERAAALVPMLRERAAEAEQARRLAPETFDALSEADVFRMTAPKRFGGHEADFQTQCDVLAQLARGCPSTSWVATILSAMSWLAAVYPDEAQEEVFATRDPRISGVFSPTGTAVSQKGGYVVNGRWGYNTGGHGSDWTFVNAVLMDSSGNGLPMCMLAPSRSFTRLDDWNASGMAATGSSTIVAENLFVPTHRAIPLPDMLEAKYPQRHNTGNPYFNYPLAPVLAVNAGGTPLGTARGALELFEERLPGRGIPYTNYTKKIEAAVTHLQIAEASLTIDSAAAHVRLACALMDDQPGKVMSIRERIASRAHIAWSTGLARDAVDVLFYASGASSIQSNVPIQRFQRDIQALSNHAIMHPQTAAELYGRVLCGLEPNTAIY